MFKALYPKSFLKSSLILLCKSFANEMLEDNLQSVYLNTNFYLIFVSCY